MEAYSVLTSVYRSEEPAYFRLALESVCGQTLPPEEIVVVCDGALTPELDAVLAEFDGAYPGLFHVIRQAENRGLGLALQAGLPACRNEYVSRMDTDDISLPNRMELQLAYLDSHPEISVLGGQIAEFDQEPEEIVGYRQVPVSPEEVRKYAARRNPMNHMTVVMRKSHVLAAGNYQPCEKFEDYYLWARLLSQGRSLANLDQVCVLARVGRGMYQRRGGLTYFSQTLELEKHLLSAGICSRAQYVSNLLVRFCGTVLIPDRFRRHAYNAFLRKRGRDGSQTEET